MTIEEFREKYEGNLGRHTANYTEWFIVRSRDDIYRILEWYSNRPGELREDGQTAVKGIVYTTHLSAELRFEYATVRNSLLSDPAPGHYVSIRSPGCFLDGFTVLRKNQLLPQGQHLILHLLDNDPFCALGRGSIAVMTEACLKGEEDREPANCWPSEHVFAGGKCIKCGLVRRIPDELHPRNSVWARIADRIISALKCKKKRLARIGRKTAYRKKKRRQARKK